MRGQLHSILTVLKTCRARLLRRPASLYWTTNSKPLTLTLHS